MLRDWFLLLGLLVIAFMVIAPIAGSVALIDPLAARGVNRDLCGPTTTGTATCQSQTNSLETMLDLAMSIAPVTSVVAGACYDAFGGYRAGLLFLAVWCGALSAISIAPTVGAVWAVATGIAGGAGGSLVQAMAYWHVRQLRLSTPSPTSSTSLALSSNNEERQRSEDHDSNNGGSQQHHNPPPEDDDRNYAMANTAFIVAFDTSGFFSIPLQRWVGWASVPFELVFPAYAVVVAVPAGFLLYYFHRFSYPAKKGKSTAASTASSSAVVNGSLQDEEKEALPLLLAAQALPSSGVRDDEQKNVSADARTKRNSAILSEVCAIVRTAVFATHTFQIAVVLTFGTFLGSVIGSAYHRVGATHEAVSTVRTVTPYVVGVISLWSLVVGRITGRLGARRGILVVDLIQVATACVGTVLLLFGIRYESLVVVTFGYVCLFVWRASGFPMLNLLWPVVFGLTSPRGIGIAGGLASTIGGATSSVVGFVLSNAVHDDASTFFGVFAGLGTAAVVAGCAASLSMYKWRPTVLEHTAELSA